MAANRHIHETNPAHKAIIQRREEIAKAEEAAAASKARGPPDMQWTSAHYDPPEPCPHPPSDLAPDELQDDLEFIEHNEFFNDPIAPRSIASSESQGSTESGGWDGLVPEDFPPVEIQDQHAAQTSEEARPQRLTNEEWWPYRAKEVSCCEFKLRQDGLTTDYANQYLISSLLIGHTRTIISRMMYFHVRMMFSLVGTSLPDWTTVRRGKAKLRKIISMDVIGRRSVLNRPVHYLSLQKTLALEIANPLVEPHLHYYPELTEGRSVSRLSQSQKWLKELGPNTRAQMVRSGG
jgi:hypothetical protein